MADSTRRTVEQDWAADNPGGVTAPSTTTQQNGYGAVKPPYQEHNWLFQLMTNMLGNAEQHGTMEWRSTTEYAQWGWTWGSDGLLYQSQVAANLNNDPVSDDGTNWKAPSLQSAMQYESSAQSVPVAATALTVTHGLGGVPRWSQVALRCVTAQYGYAVGDEVLLSNDDGEDANKGYTIWQNTTDLGFIYDGNIRVMNRTSGGKDNITPANWNLIFRAWK